MKHKVPLMKSSVPSFEMRGGPAMSLKKPHQTFWAGYSAVALMVALSLIYLNLPVYAFALNKALLPKYFYFGLIPILVPVLLLKPKTFLTYLVSPFPLWAFVVILLNFIHILNPFNDSNMGVVDLVSTRIQVFVIAIFLGYILSVTRTETYERLFPILVAFISCAVILDFFSPGTLYPVGTEGSVLGRGAATFLNPTSAAEAMLIVFLMACTVVRMQYRMPLLMLTGIGIMVTFTRSGIIAWIFCWIFLLLKRLLPRSAVVFTFALLIAIPLLYGTFENYLSSRENSGESITNIQTRLEFFFNPNLQDDSAEERVKVLKAGWDLFVKNPVSGAGAGVTNFWLYKAGTHNQLVMLAAEYGVLGIALWASLAIILWRGKYFENKSLQFAIFCLFIFMSMFTHNMFDSPYWLVTFALMAGKRRRA
jgi:O-antigen ligase